MDDTINEQVNTKLLNKVKLFGNVIDCGRLELDNRTLKDCNWWESHYKWKVKHGLIDATTAERLLRERKELSYTSQRIS